jgi:hypothetical protein
LLIVLRLLALVHLAAALLLQVWQPAAEQGINGYVEKKL